MDEASYKDSVTDFHLFHASTIQLKLQAGHRKLSREGGRGQRVFWVSRFGDV
jgi:hypothetical protein